MNNQVYLLLGGNQGDVRKTFRQARSLIAERAGEVVSVSPVYQTEPWGFESDELFLNQVVYITSALGPEPLLDKLLEIETHMGRQRMGAGYASRPIDIDILFFNDSIINKPKLVVPHPRLHLRNFALFPMHDLSPQKIHPLLKKSIAQLKDSCPDNNRAVMMPEDANHSINA